MAERYDFYVHDNRKITFNLTEPIMREDSGVTDFVFHIPKVLNKLEVSDWAWWLVFVNAKKEKYSIALTLSDDPERPLEFNTATYTVDYAMSIKAGSVQFALEAINAGTGGAIDNEWHTQSYEIKVKETLQGNQAEYAETESDVISALLIEVRNKVNQLVGGATPLSVASVSAMTDTKKVYLNTTDKNWYYYNGSAWVSGGVYGAGDPESVHGYVEDWLDDHPEATTTVQDGVITEAKLALGVQSNIKKLLCNPEKIFREFLSADGYCKMQGGCFIDSTTVIYALSKASPTDNTVKIVEVSLSNLSILRTAILNLGHADDITYNPDTGKLYVCPFYDYDNAEAWTDLIVVNYSNLTVESTITLNTPAYGVAYDRVTQKTYIRDNSLQLYEADLDSGATTLKFTLAVTPSMFVKQGISAYNGFIAFSMYQPNAIYIVNVDDPAHIGKANLPYITNDCYLYGEHEFFDCIGNDYIFGTNLIDYTGEYYQCNLWTNMPYRSRQKSYLDEPNVMYVDAASTAVCPNGNSSNAFATLEEASLCAQVYDSGNITFRIKDGTYSGQLRGNHYVQGIGTSNDAVIINNLTVRYGMYRLYNLTLTGTLTIGENSFAYEAKCKVGDCDAIGYGMLVNYNPFKSVSCQSMSHAPVKYTSVAPLNNCGTISDYDSIVSLAQNAIDNSEYFVIKIYASTSYGGVINQGFAQLFVDKTMAEKLFSTGLQTSMLFCNNASAPAPFYCKIHCIIADNEFSITARGTDTFTIRSVQVGM